MTTIIGGKLMQVDKSALRNVVRHTDSHNRVSIFKAVNVIIKERSIYHNLHIVMLQLSSHLSGISCLFLNFH